MRPYPGQVTALALHTNWPLPHPTPDTRIPYTLHLTPGNALLAPPQPRYGLGDMSPHLAMVPMAGYNLPGASSPSSGMTQAQFQAAQLQASLLALTL